MLKAGGEEDGELVVKDRLHALHCQAECTPRAWRAGCLRPPISPAALYSGNLCPHRHVSVALLVTAVYVSLRRAILDMVGRPSFSNDHHRKQATMAPKAKQK